MDQKLIFLLGGHDLEMCVIADLLRTQHIFYKDHSLQWDNAHLSQYQEELQRYGNNFSYQIYGIELKEDIVLPTNYIRIDHHNDFISHPSALEQIAGILNISLNRYQQLVAINDKSYIPGLQTSGATPNEIAQIRYDDRKAQGVTDKEERLAEQAIREYCERIENLIIIKALSSRFSPICDRLYPYEKLLIYTNNELMYYGKGAELLTKLFETELNHEQFFYGGGKDGYIGTVHNSLSSDQLKKIVNLIKLNKYDS